MGHYNLIIDGERVQVDQSFPVINPATEEVVAECPLATEADLNRAVEAAKKAFKSWSQTTWPERQDALMKVADILEQHSEELAKILTEEQGKPMAVMGGSLFEMEGAVAWTRATASMELPVEVLQDDEQAYIELHRKPLGVIGSITPWNYPVMIAIWHIVPAILTGNTVVLKPSPMTPLASIRMAELVNKVLPAGVLNIVTDQDELGPLMSAHPDINKIVFTGSSPTGKHIMRSAAGNLKRLTLELGGNDAAIVLPDVDPAEVAPKLFGMAFINSGQVCAAIKRLYIHEDVYEAITNQMAAMASAVTVGNGLEDGVDFGPVQNQKQFELICDLAKSAKADGGKFLSGGEPLEGKGYFFPLTIVEGLNNGSRLVDEEPFGPILPVIKFKDVGEVVERANDNPNGLGGSVWSNNLELAANIASQMECGTVWINGHAMVQPNMPFGGVKDSGIGVGFGIEGLKEFTSIQAINIAKQ